MTWRTDVLHSCHIAALELFRRICWTNAGQMHRHLHLHHCILGERVYAEVNALFMHLHKRHSDITEPRSVYRSYQDT